jgi:hypothetical protein
MEFNKLKVGEVLSTTIYATIKDVLKDGIVVVDNHGREFTMKGPKFIEETMTSNYQATTEKKVSRTDVIEALLKAGDSVFTVDFIKQDGSPRTLVGRLLDTENHMGRSNVEDLLTSDKNKRRQVDHRTITSLIIKGTKYVVK